MTSTYQKFAQTFGYSSEETNRYKKPDRDHYYARLQGTGKTEYPEACDRGEIDLVN